MRTIESFKDPTHNCVDFVLLWVAHCLRHGFFAAGMSLEDVLAAAMRRPDRVLVYKYPHYPFAAKADNFKLRTPLADTPATTSEVI